MKNNKGFTLIELIASFTLALTLMFFLFQIVIVVKELYVTSGLKTEMLIRQANILRKLGDDLNKNSITSYESCGVDCYTLTFFDGTSKELRVNRSANTISYDNYVVKMVEGSEIGEFSFNQTNYTTSSIPYDSRIIISIPVTNKSIPERNFGIYLVHQYDSGV